MSIETPPPPQNLEPRYTGYSSHSVIGEVTEAVHKLLLDSYDLTDQPPRIEEDLKFVPKDREEVIYIYMYRACQNQALMNQKRLRLAPIELDGEGELAGRVFYHRPPLLMDIFYLVCVHSRFRSDAERLMGWVLCTLHYTPKLIYRPRRFVLPDGGIVDSRGRPWQARVEADDPVQVEKVSLALVDDLTVGDAINLYTLHEAPYRPFLTYRARVALDGPLYSTEGGTLVGMGDDEDGLLPHVTPPVAAEAPRKDRRPTGRIPAAAPPPKIPSPPGPEAHNLRRRFQRPTSETED